jgi:hypothetical protein
MSCDSTAHCCHDVFYTCSVDAECCFGLSCKTVGGTNRCCKPAGQSCSIADECCSYNCKGFICA